jgi:hypothetical protein
MAVNLKHGELLNGAATHGFGVWHPYGGSDFALDH